MSYKGWMSKVTTYSSFPPFCGLIPKIWYHRAEGIFSKVLENCGLAISFLQLNLIVLWEEVNRKVLVTFTLL